MRRLFLCLLLSLSSSVYSAELTPFSATYTTQYQLGWLNLKIDGTRTLSKLDDTRWLLTFNAATTGASLAEKSIFSLQGERIIPLEYHYKTGGLLNKKPLDFIFDAAQKTIQDTNQNILYRDLWQDNLQDNLSYMVQASIDLKQGKKVVHYPLMKTDFVKIYSFAVIGEEKIDTQIGPLNTLKVERIDDKKNRTIRAWFALDHDYQLVRLNESKKGKVTYQIDIHQLQELQP